MRLFHWNGYSSPSSAMRWYQCYGSASLNDRQVFRYKRMRSALVPSEICRAVSGGQIERELGIGPKAKQPSSPFRRGQPKSQTALNKLRELGPKF